MFPHNEYRAERIGRGRSGRPKGGIAVRRLAPIEAAVAATFDVPVAELHASTRRSAPVAFARQTAIYLAHTLLGLKYSVIARAFDRDRTTVAHACRMLEQRRDDPVIDGIVAELERVVGTGMEHPRVGRGR